MHYSHRFTWSEFVLEAQKPPLNDPHSSRDTNRDDWFGGVTFDGAIDLANDGWQEGVENLASITAEVIDTVSSQMDRIDWTPGLEPGALDVARYLQGEPECWLTPEMVRVAGQGRLIHVTFNGGISGGYGSETFWQHGAAVAALVECLEMAGHSVQLDWILNSQRTGTSETVVRVKEYGESLNMGRIAFALAHPAMLRRLWFAVAERYPDDERRAIDVGNGYGRPAPLVTRGDVCISEIHLGSAPRDIAQWVRDQLKTQGVELKN